MPFLSNKLLMSIGTVLAVVTAVSIILSLSLWDNFNADSIRAKRVLITGSSSGIGEALAYQYSKWGASVVVTGRREAHLRKVADKCKTLGATKVTYVVADMMQPSDRQRLVDDTEKFLGGLDHLILNHADMKFIPWHLTSKNVTVLRDLMEVNFVSHVDIASKSLKMLISSGGNIGVISSVLGKVPVWIATEYIATKSALHGFFGSLDQEFRLNNTCNVSVSMVIMGYVSTEAANAIKDTVFSQIPFYPSDLNEAVITIIKGITRRQYEIYNPFIQSWLAVTFYSFSPAFVDKILSYFLLYLCHF